MDRTTAMAVATAGMVLEHTHVSEVTDQTRIGVVLGTSTGSIKSIVDFTCESWTQEKPYLVNPMLFTHGVIMNCAASQCAIWHKLKGVNATISGGHMSGLLALQYAALTIRRGYADMLLTGAVEEFCEQSAWTYYHTRLAEFPQSHPLGEGCAAFLVENSQAAQTKKRKVLAEVLACEIGVYPALDGSESQEQAEGLATCIRRVLERSNVASGEIWAVSTSQCGDPELNRVEDEALSLTLPGIDLAHQFAISDLLGDCFSASGVFQLAALLALFDCLPGEGKRRHALITAVAHDGVVGCVLIREGN